MQLHCLRSFAIYQLNMYNEIDVVSLKQGRIFREETGDCYVSRIILPVHRLS